MNAFNDILGHVGNAADALVLGGVVGKTRRRNAFADMIDQGDYQGAQDLALRSRAPVYAEYASGLAQSKQDQDKARSEKFDQNLVNLAAHLDSVQDPQMRMATIQTMMPFYVQQGMIDAGDVDFIMQAAQAPGGLSALVGLNTPAQDQFSNRMDMRKADQADYSNQTGRMNAQVGATNANIAQQRLGLDRQKFGEDQRQFDITSSQTEDKMAFDQRIEEQKLAAPRADKPATEGERKFATFARMASNAQDTINRLEADSSFNATMVQPGSNNVLRNTEGQQYQAAKRAFIDAIIRPMTGAAVTEFEFKSAEERFFPKLGDDPQTVEFKRQLRQEAIDSISAGAGRAQYILDGRSQSAAPTQDDPLGIR